MKISSIAVTDLKQYANVYHTLDDTLFSNILLAGKQFISSYCGLPLVRPTSMPVVNPVTPGATTITGTGTASNTITVTFADNTTATATVVGTAWTLTVPSTTNMDEGDVIQITQTTVSGSVSPPLKVTVDYNVSIYPPCVDDFEDLTIALFVLSNEMYDNRMMTVDNNKVNFVIKQILDSHSTNLL